MDSLGTLGAGVTCAIASEPSDPCSPPLWTDRGHKGPGLPCGNPQSATRKSFPGRGLCRVGGIRLGQALGIGITEAPLPSADVYSIHSGHQGPRGRHQPAHL